MKKIYVFGSLIMDHTTMSDYLPKDGESVFGKDFYVSYGGKGINQAMMIKRLTDQVSMIGALGNDTNGQSFISLLKKYNFDLSKIFIKDNVPTGISNIIIDKTGQNRIIVVPGANYYLTSEDVLSIKDSIENDSIFLISNEIPIETIKTIIDLGKSKNEYIILNPAPYKDIDKNTLNKVDLITPNENEVVDLFKLAKYDEKEILNKFDELKTKYLIITLGEKGCLYYDHKTIEHIPAYKVEVIDTVGAGDAFNGGLAYGISQGLEIRQALKIANSCGALAIQNKGALNAQPSKQELHDFMNKH